MATATSSPDTNTDAAATNRIYFLKYPSDHTDIIELRLEPSKPKKKKVDLKKWERMRWKTRKGS